MADRAELLHRQMTLAAFGDFVLDHDDLDDILQEGCRLVAQALDADLAKIMEIEAGTNTAVVRAGVGWHAGVVGTARVTLDSDTSEAFAISQGRPVISNAIRSEMKFAFADFLLAHGVKAMVNVPIFLPGRLAFGVLQVDATREREFDEDDIAFLKTYAHMLGPVIDRLKTQVELRRTDERLRLITQNARDYVLIISDADDKITDWLGGSTAILGWPAEEVLGQPTDLLFTEADRAADVPAEELRAARETGVGTNVRWHRRRDGSRVFLDGQTIALRDDQGNLHGYLKIGQDVSERRRAQERQATLLAELQHRVRNVLALVGSLIQRTSAAGGSAEELRKQLAGRVDALARTQVLLTQGVGTGVPLEHLIRSEMEGQSIDSAQYTYEGPVVLLSAKTAEIMTLAVHELATNAVKHGAFGKPDGRLNASWEQFEEDGLPWLRLDWVESGMELDPHAPRRMGFGSQLITSRVPYELDGRAEITFRPEGLRCRIEAPLNLGQSILATDGIASGHSNIRK